MGKSEKRFYAVVKGRTPGIYRTWYGPDGAQAQVGSFPGALYKGFASFEEASDYLKSGGVHGFPGRSSEKHPDAQAKQQPSAMSREESSNGIEIYADGGCLNNPGPGGYGVVIVRDGEKKELSGGYRHTTNNRMELSAVITALITIKEECNKPVTVYTDSRYVVDGMTKGWARKWRRNNWMRDARQCAENIDLWAKLLDLSEECKPEFRWIKGHAGHTENERCDVLAKRAASGSNLPPDSAYEKGETKICPPVLF